MMENNYTSKVFSELSKIIPNDFLAYEFFLEVSRSQYHELWNTCFVKAAMIHGNSSIDIRTNNDRAGQALGIMCQELMKISSSALYNFSCFLLKFIAGTGNKRFP